MNPLPIESIGSQYGESTHNEFPDYENGSNDSTTIRDDTNYANVQAFTPWDKVFVEPNLSEDTSIVELESDGDSEGGKWPTFRAATEMKDPTCIYFTLGMTFASKQEFKEAVHNYAFKNGKDLKFVKNDKERFHS
ncbi:PREDICTED: uncharacterized protein LOC109184118 [Ipomoea nil]|uniref:uncharacterized protein LOC109184118 n=1 Tax=Ipomoea nil TaxID=35883 RepID=UPI0009015F55|nr:PREDICTED: uncharacterized protein LOC109184118 [Ipomoea nil]